MIDLDPSIVIGVTGPTSPLAPQIAAALKAVPEVDACLSELVRLERLMQPNRTKDAARVARIEAFFVGMTGLPLSGRCSTSRSNCAQTTGASRRPMPCISPLPASRLGGVRTNDLDLVQRNVGLTFRTF